MEKNIIDRFISNAKQYPMRVAVVDSEDGITYQTLDSQSNVIANKLASSSYTILLLPRLRYYHIATLGVLKTGGKYVYISPEYPDDRIKFIMKDCAAKDIITTKEVWKQHNDGLQSTIEEIGGRVIEIDTIDWEKEDCSPINNLSPDQEAFVLYTSGTTGNPKGVVHTVKSLTNILRFNFKEDYSENDIITTAVVMDLSFAAAIVDIYEPILKGGTVHIISESMRTNMNALTEYVEKHGICRSCVGSAMGVELLRSYKLGYKELVVAGDKVVGITPEMIQNSGIEMYNGYGASEAGYELKYRITGHETVVPIGKPVCEDDKVYILDADLNEVPDGQMGEIYFSSHNVADRYLNLPELSEDRFRPDPFREGYRMLRSCDIGYKDENGNVVLSGRADNMFKLRGFRIEPGEVENVAAAFPCVGSSVCIKKTVNGEETLCLFFEATEKIDKESLREHLASKLAHYMVPQLIIQLDALPRNARGKVDRKSMPEPKSDYEVLMIKPANAKEEILYSIACEILGHNDFGVTDNLFAIGMSSIMAMKMVAKADSKQIKLKVSDVMRLKTIRGVLQNEMRLMTWYNEYDENRETVVFTNGIALNKNVEQKYQMWAQNYNVLVIEAVQDHYHYIFQDETINEVVAFYYDLLDVYIPEDAKVKVFTGVSFGGKLSYMLACKWAENHAEKPTVVMGDSLLWIEPTLTVSILNGTLDEWIKHHPGSEQAFNPSFKERITMVTMLERYGVKLQPYDGDVVLLHANVNMMPVDNADLWRPYASNLIVLPMDYAHDVICLDRDTTMPMWRTVYSAIVAGESLVAEYLLCKNNERQ